MLDTAGMVLTTVSLLTHCQMGVERTAQADSLIGGRWGVNTVSPSTVRGGDPWLPEAGQPAHQRQDDGRAHTAALAFRMGLHYCPP